jgi:hypothetical protein
MTAVIFVGPSLPPNARLNLGSGIDWRPPVRQGELYRAALGRPAVIGVIDGYFEVTPTVWHKEILWAMTEGIHVFGAASIGALRAAELDVFGMKGIGRIYEDYRDGVLEDDDEVAVLHGPAELGYPPLTEAMVNIRATLAAAISASIVSAALAAELTAIAKSLLYKERTYGAMLDGAAKAGLHASELVWFGEWLPAGRVDQKRLDALATLDAIRSHLAAEVPPLHVSYEFADTAAWHAAARRVREELLYPRATERAQMGRFP